MVAVAYFERKIAGLAAWHNRN